jgi:hypothetical protein
MGKAKDGSNCYTRTNAGGGKYVTCEGTQKGGVTKKATDARKELRKKVPEKKTVTKAQFDNARKKLAGATASGKTNKPARKKLGVKIEKPKPKNTIGGRPAGKRVDTGGARNVGIVVKTTPKPDKATLQTVMGIMAEVGKENKSNYRVPEKWDPHSTPPLKLLTGRGNEAVPYTGEDRWDVVRIFNRNGGGKGKLYEATFQEMKGEVLDITAGHRNINRRRETTRIFNIVAIRDKESKKIIGFGYDASSRKHIQEYDPDDLMSDREYHPRRQFRFEGGDAIKYPKKRKQQEDIKYDIGKVVKYIERDSFYMNLRKESDKIQKAFHYGKYNDYETDEASSDLITKVSFGTPVYSMRDLTARMVYRQD